MKTKLFILLFPILGFGQTQVGDDIVGELNSNSGRSVSLSADGKTLAVGAPSATDNGTSSGQVRVYRNTAEGWTQEGAAINGKAAYETVGSFVSLSADSNTLAIVTNNGLIRVYKKEDGDWKQQGIDVKVAFSNGCFYGNGLSLSSNGNVFAVVARGQSDGDAIQAKVYKNWNGNWTQIGNTIIGGASSYCSTQSISLSVDGSILAIGASAGNANGENSGQVQVYKNNDGNWVQLGTTFNGKKGSYFGASVSLAADGGTLAIGAYGAKSNGEYSGQVKVYKWNSTRWTELTAINGEASGYYFGISVSLSAAGNVLAIGATGGNANGVNSGQVKVYKNRVEGWIQVACINGNANDYSGNSVSLSADGSIEAIGATSSNNGFSGKVRVFGPLHL